MTIPFWMVVVFWLHQFFSGDIALSAVYDDHEDKLNPIRKFYKSMMKKSKYWKWIVFLLLCCRQYRS